MPDERKPDLLPTEEASWFLAGELGLKSEIWYYRLANWRKPGRKAVIPHLTDDKGAPVYDLTVLRAFVNEQLSKQKLRAGDGVGAKPRAAATPVFGDPDRRPFVQLVVLAGPATQVTVALDEHAARQLGEELLKSAHLLKLHAPVAHAEVAGEA